MNDTNAEVLQLARIIWDFHQLRHQPISADVIVALGTNDLRVAHFAAELYHRGLGSWIVCTGGVAHQNDLLATSWSKTEAEMYADALREQRVPDAQIILETAATNTGENVRFTRRLLRERSLAPRNILYAVKPFMQRRTMATHAVDWPEMPATVASPPMALEDYFTDELTPERVINIMVGDLQRLRVYGQRGLQAPQIIPPEVRDAFDRLTALGFTRHLIAAHPEPARV